MPADKKLTRNIKDGDRVYPKEYRHQFAIDMIEQAINNIDLEIAQKKRAIKVILLDRALDQGPVWFMGLRIRKMQVERYRLRRSLKLLTKNNREEKEHIEIIARTNKPLK